MGGQRNKWRNDLNFRKEVYTQYKLNLRLKDIRVKLESFEVNIKAAFISAFFLLFFLDNQGRRSINQTNRQTALTC